MSGACYVSCEVNKVRIASLHVYPIKGARGIALEEAELLASGLRHDRRFMVLGADGLFVTQRAEPRLALVDVAIDRVHDRLRLSVASSGLSASVPLTPPTPDADGWRRVRVWDDDVDALDVGGEGAELLSRHLGQACSLVYMPLDVIRPVDPKYARPGDRVGFADGYPVLIASLASLEDLNARLRAKGEAPVPMDRFRPSIVVDGGEAYDEERFPTARIGSLTLRLPKRCARCQVTTVDQSTSVVGKEPLRTLASYRTEANKVNFAMNAIPDLAPEASAVLRVGDEIVYE